MARRSSTIGHDPLKAVGKDEPPASASAKPAATPEPAAPDSAPTHSTAIVPHAAHAAHHHHYEARALAIVRSYYGWSAAAGLVPLPVIDLAAIVGVQVKMLSAIAELYEIPFDAKMVRPLVVALVSGTGGWLLAGSAASLVKAIPGIGLLLGLAAHPALAAASCWATGRVFIMHFESGGTFLDFNPAEMRAYYAHHFRTASAKA